MGNGSEEMRSQIAGAAAIYVPMACSAWVFLLLADMDIRSDGTSPMLRPTNQPTVSLMRLVNESRMSVG